MNKHTPGPWVATPIRDDARGFRVREIRHQSERAIGGTHVEVHELGSDGALRRLDADARLIAAAPDLLAALKAILGSVSDVWSKDDTVVSEKALRLGREAVAKAEGDL